MVVVLWVFGPMTDQMTAACRSDESSHLITKATHARSDGLLDNLEAVEAASTGAHATSARSGCTCIVSRRRPCGSVVVLGAISAYLWR